VLSQTREIGFMMERRPEWIFSVHPNIPKEPEKSVFPLERKLPRIDDRRLRKLASINVIRANLRSPIIGALAKRKSRFFRFFGYSKPWKNCFLKDNLIVFVFYKIVDFFCSLLVFLKNEKQKDVHIKKILLSNWGSLGDVVLSTGVIAAIRDDYPDCRIGFLVSAQSRVVLETCQRVDWIHVIENWVRPERTKLQKVLDYLYFIFIQQPRLVKEVSVIKYDCAIELRPFFPNVIPVFWKAGIPLRIGFTSSGNRFLLNKRVDWIQYRYLPNCYGALLEKIGIHKKKSRSLMPCLTLDPFPDEPSDPYIIFHLCSSNEAKELTVAFWKDLYQHCRDLGYVVYFTGQGYREHAIISTIVGLTEYNLCNRLGWKAFVAYIRSSWGVVSVDSVPVHLAASFQVPCAVLFKMTPYPDLWKPDNSSTVAFGIEKEVEVEEVFSLVKEWMADLKPKK
jgi:ADP-heptose:LPS heptosyltransferase